MLDTFSGFDDSLLGRILLRLVILMTVCRRLLRFVIYDQVDCHQNHEMFLAPKKKNPKQNKNKQTNPWTRK